MSDDVIEDEVTEETTTVKLYDSNEGLYKRDGGPYLDVLEREQAEIRRAKIEKREPDLDSPPPVAGTNLVVKSKLYEMDASRSHGIPEDAEPDVEPLETYEADTSSALDADADPNQVDTDNDTQTFKGDWDNDTQLTGRPEEPVQDETLFDDESTEEQK